MQVMRENLAESSPLLSDVDEEEIDLDCLSGAAVAIFDELASSITQVVNLFLDGKFLNSLSLHAWYLDDGTIVGDTMVVGKEDPRSRLAGIFPPNIDQPMHGVKLLGGPVSVDSNFCNELVMKRVAKTIRLMDAIAKINDAQCELLLLRSCMGIF
nr:hypothetical protein [Tanacetum cinerariifolium]